MNVKNTWKIVKNRYRFSPKTQMNFELSFPKFVVGKCRCTTNNSYEIKTQKVSLSREGVVFSDTIPLSWFTSSVLIPWAKVLEIAISDTPASIDDTNLNKQTFDSQYCTLRLNDPQEMTIALPWSKEFIDYVQRNKLFDI